LGFESLPRSLGKAPETGLFVGGRQFRVSSGRLRTVPRVRDALASLRARPQLTGVRRRSHARGFTVRLIAPAVVVAAFLLGSEGSSARPVADTGRGSAGRVTRIRVALVDFRIRLSAQRLPAGRVVFEVVNTGAVAHDFVLARGERTRLLPPRGHQAISVTLSKPGLYRFYCSVPGHRALGMLGQFRVGPAPARQATPRPAPAAPAPSTTGIARLTVVLDHLGSVTDVVAPPGDAHRLMVVQQNGLVLLVEDGALRHRPFLDLRRFVRAEGEKGLLGVAFAPDYSASGLLYAYYNDVNGNVRLDEFRRSRRDPDLADRVGRPVLRIVKPTADHNGGMLQFGPDGYLYVAVGDGGADPPAIPVGATGQTLDDLFGSILRIDPRHGPPYAVPPENPFVKTPNARPEIVAYGLRNPWRFWIDTPTNTMLIGDVGESTYEEIDRLPLDQLGLDFGWPCREGTTTPHVVIPPTCATAELTPPIFEYPHSGNRCSITGGVVSRDPRLPRLDGLYLWSDLCDGRLYAIDPAAPTITEMPLGVTVPKPTSFGVDALGRTYVASVDGTVYRLDPAPPPSVGTAAFPRSL
jgi:glucose/arabinose dehydrogenase